ncbi:MAG TPA: class F sortase [Patescibacteria group bacterium]|nr:class F sortase [Patescibacteria group bacterium]
MNKAFLYGCIALILYGSSLLVPSTQQVAYEQALRPSVATAQIEAPPAVVPASMEITNIRLKAKLTPLTLSSDRTLPVPKDPFAVGWYNATGPLVLVGHYDSPTDVAVFYNLKKLKSGEMVSVTSSDGAISSYTIDKVASYPIAKFPTQEVYNAGSDQLRLLTCAGTFNHKTNRYSHNLVVFATRNK